MRTLRVMLRSILIVVGLILTIALWAPITTFADLARPQRVEERDTDKPQLVAYHTQRWGLFQYYLHTEAVYLSGQRQENREVESSFRLGGLAATLLAFLVVLSMTVAAIKPAFASCVIRRLTKRWSGP